MMLLHAMLLLVLAVHQTKATVFVPDCEQCDYDNNIGYVNSTDYCGVYAVCDRNNPDDYTIMCCPSGLEFNVGHLTCEFPKSDYVCDDSYVCPYYTLPADVPCPYYADTSDTRQFIVPSEPVEIVRCPKGEEWNQTICSCEAGPDIDSVPRCDELLNFAFTDGSFDSKSCNNFAAGELHKDPIVADDVLCLNGTGQFLAIPFLNNWFAWNPIGLNFSLDFFYLPRDEGLTNGMFSFNCFLDPSNLIALGHVDGVLVYAIAGVKGQSSGGYTPTTGAFTHIALTYNDGFLSIYVNGGVVDTFDLGPSAHFNSQVAATLGFINDYDSFLGYIDDFRFYSYILDATAVQELSDNGPSNLIFP